MCDVHHSLSTGFSDLSQDDQLMSIKAGFLESWLTHLARHFDQEQSTVMFSDGSVVSRDHLEFIFNVSNGVNEYMG